MTAVMTRLSPVDQIAIIGMGSTNPLGNLDTAYQVRTGQFNQAVAALARRMDLVEVRDGKYYQKREVVYGQRRPITDGRAETPLTKDEVATLCAGDVGKGIGIRVTNPTDTEDGYDPQSYESWTEVVLREPVTVMGHLYPAGQRIRVPKTNVHKVSHSGAVPSGWDPLSEGGFKDPYWDAAPRTQVLQHRALADAIISTGGPWSKLARLVPPDRRHVAAAIAMAPGKYFAESGANPKLAKRVTPNHLRQVLFTSHAFPVARALKATSVSVRGSACETGLSNLEDAYMRFLLGDIDLAVVSTGESALNEVTFLGFYAALALSIDAAVRKTGDHPSLISMPAAFYRAGFIPGEGNTVLILLRLGMALAAGTNIWGLEIGSGIGTALGGGMDVAAPTVGIEYAMERAYARAAKLRGGCPDDYARQTQLENSHLTTTPAGDKNQLDWMDGYLRRKGRDPRNPLIMVGDKGGPRIPESGFPNGIGMAHLLGGAGSLAVAMNMQMYEHGVIPPTIGSLATFDPAFLDLEHIVLPMVPMKADGLHLTTATALGFGDYNGVNVQEAYDPDLWEGGREARAAQAEAKAWMAEQFAAIESGRVRAADYVPNFNDPDPYGT